MVIAQDRAALGLLPSDLVDEVVDVGLGVRVLHTDVGFLLGEEVLDGEKEVGLAEPRSAVDEEGVDLTGFVSPGGEALRRLVGVLVLVAVDERGEGELRCDGGLGEDLLLGCLLDDGCGGRRGRGPVHAGHELMVVVARKRVPDLDAALGAARHIRDERGSRGWSGRDGRHRLRHPIGLVRRGSRGGADQLGLGCGCAGGGLQRWGLGGSEDTERHGGERDLLDISLDQTPIPLQVRDREPAGGFYGQGLVCQVSTDGLQEHLHETVIAAVALKVRGDVGEEDLGFAFHGNLSLACSW